MPSTSTLLTGLSLATNIAREATDSVPIAKQVLGVASRIVGLAEQISKNREDLHALAGRAKKLDDTITAVIGERDLDDLLLRRLEDMNAVLRSIEEHFGDHIKQGRVCKTLRYIFTARKDVDRLREEFDDRLKELEVAANLDTNISSRENSMFIGEFRNIRHCELTLLRPILGPDENTESGPGIFHLATCEGSNKLFVVRTAMRSGDHERRRRYIEHNQILERLSLIQNRHPRIACLYGRNTGPKDNRFVVLEAGEICLFEVALRARTPDISVIGQMVAQLADASCHLQKHGAAWIIQAGCYPEVYVDINYRPTIGICDDLSTIGERPGIKWDWVSAILGNILDESTTILHLQEHPSSSDHGARTWSIGLFGWLIDSGYHTLHRENMVRRADIASIIPLSEESQVYLHREDRSCGLVLPTWGAVLLCLALGTRKCDGSIMRARYTADLSGDRLGDSLIVCCVEGDVDVVYHTETYIEIPGSVAEEVRQQLGITEVVREEDLYQQRFERDDPTRAVNIYLQHLASDGDESTVCTGSIPWCHRLTLW